MLKVITPPLAFGNMAGLLIGSFLCYVIGFIGPFAFVGKSLTPPVNL